MDAMLDQIAEPSMGTRIHPTAFVDPRAEIGTGVSIGPFCTVGPDVAIGDGTVLVSHVVVDGHTTIGAGAKLFPFCTVGLEPQDFKYKGEPTRCEVGDRTHVREHCTIHRGTVTGRGVTSVGSDCLLMAVVHVAHDCQLGNGVIVANNVVMGGHVSIGDGAVLGGQSAIHQFVRIGRAAMIGGVTGVGDDVIPFGFAFGNRAQLVGLNVVGLRRRGVDKAQIQQLHVAYKVLFGQEGVFQDRLEETRTRFAADPLVAEVLAFIDADRNRKLVRPD
jgi:UDP-N-acetylglucosamine acyltransferase